MGVSQGAVVPITVETDTTLRWLTSARPEYLDPEWQATHAFTAMVEALMQLEMIPVTGRGVWKTRVAWEALLAGRNWRCADWERRRLENRE